MAVRVDSIVLFAPVLDDNTGLCQREEPLLIQALITQAVMEAFHMTILPRTSRFDVERFDFILTEILSGNPGDKLRAIVGTNVTRYSAFRDCTFKSSQYIMRFQATRYR